MAILGLNLNDVSEFNDKVKKVKEKIKNNEEYRNSILHHKNNYSHIYNYLKKFIEFLKYSYEIKVNNLYRVRQVKANKPFSSRKELIYPKASITQEDRMNNTKFRVLYVSLHEYTAMAETRINNEYIGKKFQLTRFSTTKNLIVFNLGKFSQLYFNSPRDSDFVKEEIKKIFNSDLQEETIQGYAALECTVADILYNSDDNYHILSSILADVIFNTIPKIDAIMYPSMQNKYGINLAIKQESADLLDISYTSLNELINVFENGFYKYYTKMDCLDFTNEYKLKFNKQDRNCIYR